MNDEEMLKGCMANEERAQKHLFDRYSRVMTGVCMRYADRYEEAQDMVQNGFIKVFKKINTFSGTGSLEGWIRKIMVNTALDYLRSNKNYRFNLQVEEVDYKLEKKEHTESQLQADFLLELINGLPIGYKTVFNLYAIEGYTHKEIGEKLDISENTSKSQYSRARSLLQKQLEKIGYDINFG
jgi:RNA polymerase sigma-70 factor (ECF subfamily)